VLRNLLASAALFATASLAQPNISASAVKTSSPTDEQAQVRVRYGVAIRSGAESDSGPGLSYAGVSPNDLALTGWLWFLAGDHLGLTAAVQREAFSLLDNGATVTSGGLIRAAVGPTGRVRFGPARLEAAASYSFQQLPVFGTVSTPAFATVQRHGVLLAARALVDLGPVTLEGRFEYPIAIATVGRPVRSQGLGAGGAVRVQLFRTGMLKWGLLADAQWHQDSLATTDAAAPLQASQSVVRAGLALDVQVKDPRLDAAPTTGALRVKVRGEQGPLAGAAISIRVGATTRALSSDAEGVAFLPDLEPGEVVTTVTMPGFEPGEARVGLAAGEERELELGLVRETPKVGALAIKVVSFDGRAPVVATIEVNGQRTTSSTWSVDGLPPGPVSVKVTAPGFNPGEEAASIVAGQSSELTVTLVPEKKRVPATLSGQVRSARGGKPVVAQLEVRELKQTISADDAGAFSVQIPGGKYTVRISAPGFVTQTKSVTVRDGDQAIFNVDLAPK
jgi:uncharacterized membrane protein